MEGGISLAGANFTVGLRFLGRGACADIHGERDSASERVHDCPDVGHQQLGASGGNWLHRNNQVAVYRQPFRQRIGPFAGRLGIGDKFFGQVAGSFYGVSQVPLPFIGTSSGSAFIPIPVGWQAGSGLAINDSGQVVVTECSICPPPQSVIATLNGSTLVSGGNATAINASGYVTGTIPPLPPVGFPRLSSARLPP